MVVINFDTFRLFAILGLNVPTRDWRGRRPITFFLLIITALGITLIIFPPVRAHAVVLPEDRADAMYHYYKGGGIEVSGPALLVRKSFAEKASISAGYYADSISGASIDVVTTASPYKEKRDEYRYGLDYLHRNSLMSVSYITSEENDYLANAINLDISHEMFGGQTTVNLGYTRGEDEVGRVDTSFRQDINRYQFRLGVAQVLTRSLIMNLEYEGITEEGFLSNPYRSARILGASIPERYPNTRSSHAVSLKAIQGLTSGSGRLTSSLSLGYRYFWDTWEIAANDVELGYRRYFGDRWTGEVRYRYYSQEKASFYSDNFVSEQNFMARDKELSSFASQTLGGRVSYAFVSDGKVFDKSSINLAYDFIRFDYDDFTDVRTDQLYSFDANVVQLYVSLWF